jgi:glycosyltransferase involved in cell wall biosynthesis
MRGKNQKRAAFTIVSKNYLAQARVLSESFQAHNPGVPFFVLLADEIEGRFDPSNESFETIPLLDAGIPHVYEMCMKYSVIELNTAVKPYFFAYLFSKGFAKVVYLDPDILVLDSLSEVYGLLDKHNAVVTPHITKPYCDSKFPTEVQILLSGVYNLGFIGLANNAEMRGFVKWWGERLWSQCFMDPENGMHVDQKWVDLALGFFDGFFILKDSAYNVAYWNICHREIAFKGEKAFCDGTQCKFFHFSGFDPEKPNIVSKHQDRIAMRDLGEARRLFELYASLLFKHGFRETRKWGYAFSDFDNGVRIPPVARKLYAELGPKAREFGNPFSAGGKGSFFSWLNLPAEAGKKVTHLWYGVYLEREDLLNAYSDVLGAEQDYFLYWILHYGEKETGIGKEFIPPALEAAANKAAKPKLPVRVVKKMYYLVEPVAKPLARRFLNKTPLYAKLKRLRNRVTRPARTPGGARTGSYASRLEGEFGVNLAGYFTGNYGVAASSKAFAEAISEAGIPHALNNITSDFHRSVNSGLSFSDKNPFAFNIVHVNADVLPDFAGLKGQKYFQGKYSIGVWYFEQSVFPAEWMDRFGLLDEIWVTSGFIQEALAKISPIPVVKMPYPFSLEHSKTRPDRGKFGLAEDEYVFLFVFDFLSVFERKNPLGLVKAFKAAFKKGEKARLVIKCINSDSKSPLVDPGDLKALLEAAKGHNVTVLTEYFPEKEDLMVLMASCDCYVSLHRSEGLGLTLMEAMSLQKPVIATAYSGNMEFMDVNNSFPVKCGLAKLARDYGPYKAGTVWAEPDLRHAAGVMRFVFENPKEAKEAGKRAQRDLKERMDPKTAGEAVKARLGLLQSEFKR